VLVLLLVILVEKSPGPLLRWPEQNSRGKIGRSSHADGQQIEHEHEPEDEHDGRSFGFQVKRTSAPRPQLWFFTVLRRS